MTALLLPSIFNGIVAVIVSINIVVVTVNVVVHLTLDCGESEFPAAARLLKRSSRSLRCCSLNGKPNGNNNTIIVSINETI